MPTFLTRNVTGVLRLRDGETGLIGGLLQGSEASSFSGAHRDEQHPVIGKLFGNRKKPGRAEVLISITPRIVRGPKVTEEDLVPLRVGTEEVRGSRRAAGPVRRAEADAPGGRSGARRRRAAPPRPGRRAVAAVGRCRGSAPAPDRRGPARSDPTAAAGAPRGARPGAPVPRAAPTPGSPPARRPTRAPSRRPL